MRAWFKRDPLKAGLFAAVAAAALVVAFLVLLRPTNPTDADALAALQFSHDAADLLKSAGEGSDPLLAVAASLGQRPASAVVIDCAAAGDSRLCSVLVDGASHEWLFKQHSSGWTAYPPGASK